MWALQSMKLLNPVNAIIIRIINHTHHIYRCMFTNVGLVCGPHIVEWDLDEICIPMVSNLMGMLVIILKKVHRHTYWYIVHGI